MNIQPINSINFSAKAPITNIKQIGELDGYATQMLNECYGTVDSFARNFGKEVRIAQKGKSLIVNAGQLTTMFNPWELKNPARDFSKCIINNIRANTIAEEHDLQKGIEYIELNAPEVVGSKLNIIA